MRDLCLCCQSVPEGNTDVGCCAFFCTPCLYHKLVDGRMDEYNEATCTSMCLADVLWYEFMAISAMLCSCSFAVTLPPALGMVVSSGFSAAGVLGSMIWQSCISQYALRVHRPSLQNKYGMNDAMVTYNIPSFMFCTPCVYYNLYADGPKTARKRQEKNRQY